MCMPSFWGFRQGLVCPRHIKFSPFSREWSNWFQKHLAHSFYQKDIQCLWVLSAHWGGSWFNRCHVSPAKRKMVACPQRVYHTLPATVQAHSSFNMWLIKWKELTKIQTFTLLTLPHSSFYLHKKQTENKSSPGNRHWICSTAFLANSTLLNVTNNLPSPSYYSLQLEVYQESQLWVARLESISLQATKTHISLPRWIAKRVPNCSWTNRGTPRGTTEKPGDFHICTTS